MRLMGFAFDAGGSPLVMHELIVEFNRQAVLRAGADDGAGDPDGAVVTFGYGAVTSVHLEVRG